ncbi:MAG: hydrogenase expression/formation protein HypE [bacterium]
MRDACPAPLPHTEHIVLGHGSGGRLTQQLIEGVFYPLLDNPVLAVGDDAALPGLDAEDLEGSLGPGRLALTTDAHMVSPLEFPGGDIGRLAVCGTVNDLVVVGARPLWITAAFMLEEGLETALLTRIVASMRQAADEAGVIVVAGDTKVAERGKVDGLYISTAGAGWVPAGRDASGRGARPGDAVLLSGTLGDHGIAVLAARGELAFETDLTSDVASLHTLVEGLYGSGARIHAMRDPTRGGLAATLNEIACQSTVRIVLEEESLPVRPEVEGACEMLGFDSLLVANEGKLVAFVPAEDADRALEAMKDHPLGTDAALIGHVESADRPEVHLHTAIGGTRIVERPAGELLPRIC